MQNLQNTRTFKHFGVFTIHRFGNEKTRQARTQQGTVNKQLNNFLNALQLDVEKLAIPELELDLDFNNLGGNIY